MRTKQVVDRQRAAQAIGAAAKTHASEIVQGLHVRFLPLLKRGEKAPDTSLLCELLARASAAALEQLLLAEEAYQKELLDDDPPRRERDEAAGALSEALVELREVVAGVYGSGVLKEAGFSQGTPQDPVLLSRFAGQVANALPEASLPPPRVTGAVLDRKAIAAELLKKRARLDDALAAVARESREAQAALSQRNQTQAEFDDTQAGITAVLAGLLQLAGKRDLAERVRPPVVRRGSRPQEPEPSPPPSPV